LPAPLVMMASSGRRWRSQQHRPRPSAGSREWPAAGRSRRGNRPAPAGCGALQRISRGGCTALQRCREGPRRGVDPEPGVIDPAEFATVGMNMHQRLRRHRNVEQRVGLRRHLRHAPARQDDEVGLGDPCPQLRVGGDADLACVVRVLARKQHLPPQRPPPAGRSARRSAMHAARSGFLRPAAAAQAQQIGPLRRPAGVFCSSAMLRQARRGFPGSNAAVAATTAAGAQQACPPAARSPPAPGRPCMATWKARDDDLGNARRDPRSRSPIWPSSRKRRGSRSPGTRRGSRMARVDLADEQDQPAPSPARAMWMPAEALVAPGPRVTMHHAGPAGRAAPRRRPSSPAPPSCRQTVTVDAGIVQRVEHRQIALARHAEHVLDALGNKAIDDQFAAGALGKGCIGHRGVTGAAGVRQGQGEGLGVVVAATRPPQAGSASTASVSAPSRGEAVARRHLGDAVERDRRAHRRHAAAGCGRVGEIDARTRAPAPAGRRTRRPRC